MINDYQELQDRTDENEKRHPVDDYQESQKKERSRLADCFKCFDRYLFDMYGGTNQ